MGTAHRLLVYRVGVEKRDSKRRKVNCSRTISFSSKFWLATPIILTLDQSKLYIFKTWIMYMFYQSLTWGRHQATGIYQLSACQRCITVQTIMKESETVEETSKHI